MPVSEQVILVDRQDTPIGVEEKLAAHEKALLHRAFSVFVFRYRQAQWELLLQQRNPAKYHSGGLWTNTCCSHPRPEEDIISAGQRRLQQEMGFVVPLQHVGSFIYQAAFSNGLTEHEYDHVLIGHGEDISVVPNPEEVADYQWLPLEAVENAEHVLYHNYTPWFKQALIIAKEYLPGLLSIK